MFGIFLTGLGFIILYLVTRREHSEHPAVAWTLQGAYTLRLFLQFFLRDIPFFTGGTTSGDCETYEDRGWLFAQMWNHTGYHYITAEEYPVVGNTSLPSNLFGTVMYINGDRTRIGCTAVVALSACLACYNLYRLSIELGAKEPFAFRVMLLTIFGPAVLMYTSDTFKDGFVILFTTGAVAAAFRLARKYSTLQVVLGSACLLGLWSVRYYMVFLALAPLVVGFVGLNSRSILRPVLAAAVLAAAVIAVLAYSDAGQVARTRAEETFEQASSLNARGANAEGGSGVTFDDGGSPFGAIGPKVVYTLFSPFPWQSGSIGFQIGKLDAFIWYFLAYRAFLAARVLAGQRPALLLMFLVFLVPGTIAYATTMANIGLIVRQRLPLVLIAAVLATLSEAEERQPEDSEKERGDRSDASRELKPARTFE